MVAIRAVSARSRKGGATTLLLPYIQSLKRALPYSLLPDTRVDGLHLSREPEAPGQRGCSSGGGPAPALRTQLGAGEVPGCCTLDGRGPAAGADRHAAESCFSNV